jgi:hypothetical protein
MPGFQAMRCHLKIMMEVMLLAAMFGMALCAAGNPSMQTSSHPSLLLNAGKLPEIMARLGREPYENWWSNAIQVAKAEPVARAKVEDRQVEYANRARYAAFCYFITGNETYAEISFERMKSIPRMTPEEMDGDSHLKLAHTGRDFAEAYDILLPWMSANHPDDVAAIAESLRYIGWELREFGPNWYTWHKNNHGIRQFSGLGLVALALRDDARYASEASDWLAYAEENVLIHLRYQICDPVEGGFAEGMNYFNYSGEIMWDFFYALKNVTGRDMWAEPDIRNLHVYAARTQMPTGCWPMFDDASYGYFPCQIFCDAYPSDAGLFAERFQARQAAWAAGYGEKRNDGRRLSPSDDYILSIIHYDDTVTPVPPEYAVLEVLAKAGDAVFREGEGPEAIYLNMRVENTRAAFNAAGHDNPDPLSFFLQAYGEDLLLDPGYTSWDEREKVVTADNHNMITVDDNDLMRLVVAGVPLEGFVEVVDYGMEPKPYIEARTSYRGATITRRIMFVDESYFVVYDSVESDKEHKFTYNLHGNAGEGAGGSFSLVGKTATWERDNGVGVECTVFCFGADAAYAVDSDEHSFGYGEWSTHSALRVSVTAKAVKFTTIIRPYD